jgi:hypothetical protein
MSKQTLLFSFLDKCKQVCVESEIKGAQQEVNGLLTRSGQFVLENTTILTLRSVSLKCVKAKQVNAVCGMWRHTLSDAMKPAKFKRHLNTRHGELRKKPK